MYDTKTLPDFCRSTPWESDIQYRYCPASLLTPLPMPHNYRAPEQEAGHPSQQAGRQNALYEAKTKL